MSTEAIAQALGRRRARSGAARQDPRRRPRAGAPLRELELADAYDVSRHTLRAALRELAQDGLVRIEPNRGATVARLDEADMQGSTSSAPRSSSRRHTSRSSATTDASRATCTTPSRDSPPRAVAARPPGKRSPQPTPTSTAPSFAPPGRRASRPPTPRSPPSCSCSSCSSSPVWSLDRMVSHHQELIAGLEREGPEALRRHLRDGADAVQPQRSTTSDRRGLRALQSGRTAERRLPQPGLRRRRPSRSLSRSAGPTKARARARATAPPRRSRRRSRRRSPGAGGRSSHRARRAPRARPHPVADERPPRTLRQPLHERQRRRRR